MSDQTAQETLVDLTDYTDVSVSQSIRKKVNSVKAAQNRISALYDDLNKKLLTSRKMEMPMVHSPGDAADLVEAAMRHLDHEELWIIVLDTRNRVIQLAKCYSGSANSSQVRIAELFRPAILVNGVGIIMVHNHPSGDPSPSPEDVSLTRSMVQAGKLLDIEVLDHLVIGQGRHVSLKERGMGFS